MNSIVLFISTFLFLCECSCVNILNELSVINIKVRGSGKIKILSDSFNHIYNYKEIYLNDSSLNINENANYIYSNSSDYINNVRILWNVSITSTIYMFQNCTQIIYIDLSLFDTSQVNDMSFMFQDCISLLSINFENFNTSNVDSMSHMFFNCSSLNSINLSSFETSKNKDMYRMFYNCSSLLS